MWPYWSYCSSISRLSLASQGEPPNVFVQRYSSPKKLHRCLLWARHDYLHALTRGFAHKNTHFSSSKGINLQNVDGRSQIWSGFSRQRSVKFHPSVKSSILQYKIRQPFSEFTKSV